MAFSRTERILGKAFRGLNRHIVWHRLPFWLAVTNLVALRVNLRRSNLYDTETAPPPAPEPNGFDFRHNRTVDGSYNDLSAPGMGRANTRFGRNVPLKYTFGETDEALLTPNPRLISRKLLAREEFIPATILNVLAAGWLQFMVHDWLSHENDTESEPHRIPVDDDDDWHDKPAMAVARTRPDPAHAETGRERPAAFLNTATHWWDGSQIYGSTAERLAAVRRNPDTGAPMPDGKLYLTPDGRLPLAEDGVELAGVNGAWWVALSVLHTLFAREHNAICDRLKLEHPDKDGEWLFNKARLVNAALIAKIHTVEWTPALLGTPELRFGMRGNWWGALGEDYYRANGRLGLSEVLSGIPGSATDHHAAPYSITEEFTAVYRMHALVPDDFSLRALADDRELRSCTFRDVAGANVAKLYDELSLVDVLYSLGTSHPGALTLHNHPRFLRRLDTQTHTDQPIDLAAVDILRDRERGVPRYCQFRRLLDMPAPRSFEELNPKYAKELAEIYDDVEQVDLLVGAMAELPPPGFAFSDTAFRIFILMASRRLKSDRFFTTDYRPEVYTEAGMAWIDGNDMRSVLTRHFPALKSQLDGVRNAFAPWPGAGK